MRLSKRIKHFSRYYKGHHNIYDLCCDHGLIGKSLSKIAHEQGLLDRIVFNDQVSSIIEALKLQSIDSDIPRGSIVYTTKPAEELKIDTKNNLVVIAGIGGKLAWKIVKNLSNQSLKDTDIIVSPHNNYFFFRDQVLRNTDFRFSNESFVIDKGKYYTYDKLSLDEGPYKSSLVPPYFLDTNDSDVQQFALHIYQLFKKAKSDPLRQTLLNFFITHYGAII